MQTYRVTARIAACLALLLGATLPGQAHLLVGTPDASAHNAGHVAPTLLLATVAALIVGSAVLTFKRR